MVCLPALINNTVFPHSYLISNILNRHVPTSASMVNNPSQVGIISKPAICTIKPLQPSTNKAPGALLQGNILQQSQVTNITNNSSSNFLSSFMLPGSFSICTNCSFIFNFHAQDDSIKPPKKRRLAVFSSDEEERKNN